MKKLIFGSGLSSFKDFDGLVQMCRTAINHNIMAFDTAPSYKTEEVLCAALRNVTKEKGFDRKSIWIQTKIDPIQMYNGQVDKYFIDKLASMQLDYVDALLIHWPVLKYLHRTWTELLELKNHGVANRIGICNLRIEHLKELKSMGIIPDILQIERHPLNTFAEEVAFCRENSVELQDYSPLCKMHPILRDNKQLATLSEKYGKSIGLIILRWHIDTGATPIFTSKKESRVDEYAGIEDFELSKSDCDIISALNINHKLYLESLICPGF